MKFIATTATAFFLAIWSGCSSPRAEDHELPSTNGLTGDAGSAGGGAGPTADTSDGGSDPPGAVPACATDLAPELARLGVPGLSAAIVKHGRIVCTAVAGFANIEERVPVTPGAVFWWASVSKPVAATAAMTVFEEGKFKLEDQVNKVLPFKVEHPSPACAGKEITFFELLTHTSSIQEDESLPAYTNAFVVGKPRQPLGDYLKSYLLPGGALYNPTASFLETCPGEGYQYSSIGYGLLGLSIESLTNKPFDQLVRERIFLPLGMRDTSFTLADLDRSKLAMPYGGSTPATFQALGHHEHANYPDGSLRSSVLDLARFLIMSQQFGEFRGTRILQKATVEAMFKVYITAPDEDPQGLAWYRDEFGGRAVIGHDGDDPGAGSFMFFDPADGAGVLLVANGLWDDDKAEDTLTALFNESSKY